MEKTLFAAGEMSEAQKPGYGSVAMSLHWLIVVLLVVQFVVAWCMPEIHRGVVPETLINLHMSFGVMIMPVVILRLLWRLRHPVPLVGDSAPIWQQMAAHATHGLLYLLLLVLPVLGWASASARDWPVSLFGTVTLPQLLSPNPGIGSQVGDVHTALSWVLLALIWLHVVASLYHYFILRDRVLQRMLPNGGS